MSYTAFFLAFLLSFLTIMAFYDLNPFIWIGESRVFFSYLIITTKGKIKSIISVLALILVFLSLPRIITKRLSSQGLRSFYHVVYGVLIIYFLFLSPELSFFFLSVSFGAFIGVEYLRESNDTSAFTLFIKNAMNKAMKGQEIRGYIASFFYLIGLILVILFMPVQYAMGAVLPLIFGDPTAALIGKRFGKYKWNHNPDKSLEGSVAMFLVILLALQISEFKIITTIFVAAGATIFESLKIEISDNLIIPLIAGMILMSI